MSECSVTCIALTVDVKVTLDDVKVTVDAVMRTVDNEVIFVGLMSVS